MAKRDSGLYRQRDRDGRELPTWWVSVSRHGKRIRESTGTTKITEAREYRDEIIARLKRGEWRPGNRRLGFDHFEAEVRRYAGTVRSGDRVLQAFDLHIKRLLGHCKLSQLADYVTLKTYVTDRLEEGAAPATVNYEKAVIRVALKELAKEGKIVAVPQLPTITVDNARDEFLEDWEIAALVAELSGPTVRNLVRTASRTGWRMQSELFPLRWGQVDETAGRLRLRVGTTKTKDGRTFPYAKDPELSEVIAEQRAYTRACEAMTGKHIPYVFHRNGKPVKSIREAWRAACRRAGIFGSDGKPKQPHDLRRTAVRRLERSGVARSQAKSLVGHKSDEMYERYAIPSEKDQEEAVTRVVAFEHPKGPAGHIADISAGSEAS